MEQTRTFDNENEGIQVRATLVENVKVKQSVDDEIVDTTDLWFLFIAIAESDLWLSYGVTDSMVEEPANSLDQINVEELKKMSIICGFPWKRIETDGIKRSSIRQREMVEQMDDDVEAIIMEKSFTELFEHKSFIEFHRIRKFWAKGPMVLSLN